MVEVGHVPIPVRRAQHRGHHPAGRPDPGQHVGHRMGGQPLRPVAEVLLDVGQVGVGCRGHLLGAPAAEPGQGVGAGPPGVGGAGHGVEQPPHLIGGRRVQDVPRIGHDGRDPLAGQRRLHRTALVVGADQDGDVVGTDRPGSEHPRSPPAGRRGRGGRGPGRPGPRRWRRRPRHDRRPRPCLVRLDPLAHRQAQRQRRQRLVGPDRQMWRSWTVRAAVTGTKAMRLVTECHPVEQRVQGGEHRRVRPPVGSHRSALDACAVTHGARCRSRCRRPGSRRWPAWGHPPAPGRCRRTPSPKSDLKIPHCTGSVSWNSSISATLNRLRSDSTAAVDVRTGQRVAQIGEHAVETEGAASSADAPPSGPPTPPPGSSGRPGTREAPWSSPAGSRTRSGRPAACPVASTRSFKVGRSSAGTLTDGRRGQDVGAGLPSQVVGLLDQPGVGVDAAGHSEGVADLGGEAVDGGDGGGVELGDGRPEAGAMSSRRPPTPGGGRPRRPRPRGARAPAGSATSISRSRTRARSSLVAARVKVTISSSEAEMSDSARNRVARSASA